MQSNDTCSILLTKTINFHSKYITSFGCSKRPLTTTLNRRELTDLVITYIIEDDKLTVDISEKRVDRVRKGAFIHFYLYLKEHCTSIKKFYQYLIKFVGDIGEPNN